MEQAGAVDPEVQSSISNLVSALGGINPRLGVYELGDEALSCLRDLRKWLQNYDAKYDRLEVACAIANTTLVTSDVPEILSMWECSNGDVPVAYLERIALACVELLVPLTWPIELLGQEASAEKFAQYMYLIKAHGRYKHAIVNHSSHKVLLAVIKLAAGSAMKTPQEDRDPREDGIITLVCSFFRNLIAIDADSGEDRAVVTKELDSQKVLSFLLAMTANIDTQVDTQDTVILETIYYLVRSVDIARVYGLKSSDDPLNSLMNKNLQQMLDLEADMNRGAFKPSRHSRFGTMISLNEGDGEQISLSGQRGVAGLDDTLNRLDGSKRWHKPRQQRAQDEIEKCSFMPQFSTINSDKPALDVIRSFTDMFLDTSFNPVFARIRRLVELKQTTRVTKKVLTFYCYLQGWFVEAERTRAKASNRPVDFQLIGEALSRQVFSSVFGLMHDGLGPGDMKSTDLVHSAMFCLRQIMLNVRDMSYVPDVELRDVADGLKSRLFYEDSWLNLLAQIPRSAHRKSLVYACETVALTHVALKMLDEYSQQHSYITVKTHRLRSKPKAGGSTEAAHDVYDEDDDEEGNASRDHQESRRVTNERRFSFEKFVHKYINDPTISIYEHVLKSHKEVNSESLIQAFSFFRRTFAKTTNKAMFFRMPLMNILLSLLAHNGLPADSKVRPVADQFMTYFVQKFVATATRMPSLHLQVNEVMTPADAYYYNHNGRDKERYRAPKYEFSLTSKAQSDFSPEKQTAVLVAALIDNGRASYIKQVEQKLTELVRAASEKDRDLKRSSLQLDSEILAKLPTDAILRLFLRHLGLMVNTSQGQVVLPGNIDEIALLDKLQWVAKYQQVSVEFPKGKTAMDFIKVEGESDRFDYDDEEEEENRSPQTATTTNQPSAQERFPQGPLSPSPSSSFSRNPSPGVEELAPGTPSHESDPLKSLAASRKRMHAAAFVLADDENDDDDTVMNSINAIRRRKAILDDDDE